MARLDKFTNEQKSLLVSLPYRAGLWVSRSDSTGGADSDEAEIGALRGIIMGFAEDFCKSEFVEEVMRETISRRNEWPEWEKNIESILPECRRVVDMVAEHLEQRDVMSFKHNLMEIGMTVALAYREFDGRQSWGGKIKICLRYYRQRLLSSLQNTQALSFDEYLNISRPEHQALTELSKALRVKYKEGLALQEAEPDKAREG